MKHTAYGFLYISAIIDYYNFDCNVQIHCYLCNHSPVLVNFQFLTIRNKMSASHPFYFMWCSNYGSLYLIQIIIEMESLPQSMWILMRPWVCIFKFPSGYFRLCTLCHDILISECFMVIWWVKKTSRVISLFMWNVTLCTLCIYVFAINTSPLVS